MPPPSDTLQLGQLGATYHPERHETNPHAAAAARRRIAELPDPHHRDLPPEPRVITNRHVLAAQLGQPATTQAKPHPAAKPRLRHRIPSRLRPLLAALATFGLLLALFKAPVLISQLSYHPATTGSVATSSSVVIPAANTITIPKINVHAPVIYDDSRDETQILADLQNGVIHYAGTALPGQAGNSVIFGHSSNDWWEAGNYKFVFVLLDKLQPGDQFYVDYQSKRYVYQVTGSQVVEPTNLSVIQPTATPTMTLITCTPPGTSWKRLVVTANQISPNPSSATKSTGSSQSQPNALPNTEGGGGIWDSIKSTASGIAHSVTSIFGGDQTTTPNGQLPAVK